MRYTEAIQGNADHLMPEEGTKKITVLGADEPTPFKVLNPESTKPLLLVCDHASRLCPESLGDLGVDPAVWRCHLGSDIGAGALTEQLAHATGATAVMQEYSRLVIDCNRQLMDPAAYLEFGDGVIINGNRNLGSEQREARAEEIYWPYHYALSQQIARLSEDGVAPTMLAIHSFTPVMNGVARHCEIGILWDKDRRVSVPMIEHLREHRFIVGDNEPYSGKAPQDFTIDHHAEEAGLPHVGIEIRQDLIDDDAGVDRIATVMQPLIEKIQAQIHPTNIDSRRRKQPA